MVSSLVSFYIYIYIYTIESKPGQSMARTFPTAHALLGALAPAMGPRQGPTGLRAISYLRFRQFSIETLDEPQVRQVVPRYGRTYNIIIK